MKNITSFHCRVFGTVLAEGLTTEEKVRIVEIRNTISRYSGYSVHERKKYKEILDIMGNRRIVASEQY